METAAAAALLGVAEDADEATVRAAYRLWARVAHPDAGGDPEFFEQLTRARATLQQHAGPRDSAPASPPARPPLRSVLRAPLDRGRVVLLALAAAVVVVLMAAAPMLGAGVPVSALAAGVSAAAGSVLLARVMLADDADRGHRMAVLSLTWLPLAGAAVVTSLVLSTGLVVALPLLALPFVAVIAWLNAGVGLWLPAGPRSGDRRGSF